MANEPIPVYVFTGFLESGKTKFIQDILADPNFTENERTVLLLCEEGIEEYDEKWLLHYGTALVPIESEDRLTPNILQARGAENTSRTAFLLSTTACGSWKS